MWRCSYAAYELLGFLLRSRVDVAQQTIQGEGASPDQVGRVFDGLWWHAIQALPDRIIESGGPEQPRTIFGIAA